MFHHAAIAYGSMMEQYDVKYIRPYSMVAIWSGSLAKWLRARAKATERINVFFSLVLQNVMNMFVVVASHNKMT